MSETNPDGRPVLKVVDPEHEERPEVRLSDALFEIARAHAGLAELHERAFVAVSDMLHGNGDDNE